jgi:peptidoglycan/LPS O-acetylase OafA/YrhL
LEADQAVEERQHYASLDGLRGFAAISVLIFHLGHWFQIPGLATNSGLAVDLFFCLSGYVLPLAYQRRIDTLPIGRFVQSRIVRLMPVIVLAIVISAPYVVIRDRMAGAASPFAAVASAVLLGVLNLPYFGAPKAVGGPELFPLNGPQYSLFLEIFVNTLWWANRRINPLRLSVVLSILCFLALPFTGLGGDLPDNFWSGFPRVGASFFFGVAVFHLERRLADWDGWTAAFWVLSGVMAILFYFPREVPLAVQLAWVGLVSPALVLTGSRARLSPRMRRVFLLGGLISYPLYALHYPIFCWVNGIYRAFFGLQMTAVEVPIVIVATLAASWGALKLYDEPVRRALTAGLRRRVTLTSQAAPLVRSLVNR